MCLAELCGAGSCKSMLLGVHVWQREKTFHVFCSFSGKTIAQSPLHSQPSAFFLKWAVRKYMHDHAKQGLLGFEHLDALGFSATCLGHCNCKAQRTFAHPHRIAAVPDAVCVSSRVQLVS